VITSRTPSPILRKNIAPCRMATEYPEIGTEVEVGNRTGAACASWSGSLFYDPEKTRPRC